MRARRVDANHAEIKRAFEALGCSFLDVSQTPCGFDGVAGLGGLCICVEIKDGNKPPSDRKLTDNEAKVHAAWKGGMRIVENLDHVVETVNTLRRWARVLATELVKT